MIPAISTTALSRRYRDQAALNDVSLVVEPGTVTGLLGRNGAGKTTLMRIVTGQEFPTSGAIRVFGQAPAENDAVLRRMVFVREEQAYPDFRVGHAIRVASWFYPNWDQELARWLLADFDLPPGRRIKKLSRGMRSAVGITIGLAARAELTLFDEPYAGLDRNGDDALVALLAFTNEATARGDASVSLRFEMYVSGAAVVARLRAAASVPHIRLIPGKPSNAVETAKPTTWTGRPFSVMVWPRRRSAAWAKDRSTTTPPDRIHIPSVTRGWSTAATPG